MGAWSVLAFVAGWLLSHMLTRRGHDLRSSRMPVLVQDPIDDPIVRAPEGHRYFLAGAAVGIAGNAVIAFLPYVVGPGFVGPLVLTAIAVGGVAYADTVLRGATAAAAIFDALSFVTVCVSLFLSVVTALRLAGYTCEGCQPETTAMTASFGYWVAALVLWVVRRSVAAPHGR